MSGIMAEAVYVAEVLLKRLTALLGPHTAKMALSAAVKQTGGALDRLQPADVAGVIDVLRPMLNVLLGRDNAEQLVQKMMADCKG